eukprot:CAMPEP_0172573942 /NCGR_PEP_ID=MMETSP1067-20121228/136453_1 /TAXON_ID=265564 ORGANISM="Thalassiosira punctigera, Strain Tpunct2005C2" /NCGR_SAMPLE_ID=MMETSP1067 /ASSEMBLY_ACC=CAM_ASM_000444 /LENGTH=203 /DNA_ID=CAMNT_0013366565 /DNA_START=144 /DNA_END=755 /DNA_ORIENTATION=-
MKIALTAFLVAIGHLSDEVDARQLRLRALSDRVLQFDDADTVEAKASLSTDMIVGDGGSLSIDMIVGDGGSLSMGMINAKSAKSAKSAKTPTGTPTSSPTTKSPTATPTSSPTTKSPVGMPTGSPTKIPRLSCPSVPLGGCSICGPGKCVTNPNAILVAPGFPPFSCGDLQQLGIDKQIPPATCIFLSENIGACACKEEGTII